MNLTEQQMISALRALAKHLPQSTQLIIGGGGAMMLGYHFALATADIDGVPRGLDINVLDQAVKKVAAELGIAVDWLNPYFSTFTHVLPSDYGSRLIKVLSEGNLEVLAMSKDDLLIMKCFAGRQKDVVHAKALIKAGARIDFVEGHLEFLKGRRIPNADRALDFLDDVVDQVGTKK